MRYWKVVYPKLSASAMAVYPFLIFKRPELLNDAVIVNHEKIHFKQQLELFILPFYIFYLINYLINLVRYRNHDRAYREIRFEREAYRYDRDLQYLKKRKPYSWIREW